MQSEPTKCCEYRSKMGEVLVTEDDNNHTDANKSVDDKPDDLEALATIIRILKKLDPEQRQRIFSTAATFLQIALIGGEKQSIGEIPHAVMSAESKAGLSFSAERELSAKEFMLSKEPRTDSDRVTCLAYYLTHFRNTPKFKTIDISALNTEAALPKFTNASVAVDNATKRGYLAPASRGNKQISAVGERFVQALPDREAAKAVLKGMRRRRKTRKGSGNNSS